MFNDNIQKNVVEYAPGLNWSKEHINELNVETDEKQMCAQVNVYQKRHKENFPLHLCVLNRQLHSTFG